MKITYEVGTGLYINTTNRCTNSCTFCVRTKDAYGDLWLDSEPNIEQILSEIKKCDLSKYTEIVFCGYGEPTIRLPDILSVAIELKKITILPIRMNTNGQSDLIWKRDTTQDFVGKIDIVSISLNSATPKGYQEVSISQFGENAYNALLTFANNLSSKGVHVILSIVKGTIPDEDIKICEQRAKDVGAILRVREFI